MLTFVNKFLIKKCTVRYCLVGKKDRDFVKHFFDVQPKMPLHYCHKTTTNTYMEPIVPSVAQLRKLFLEMFLQENIEAVSRFFLIIFQGTYHKSTHGRINVTCAVPTRLEMSLKMNI